MRSGCVDSRGRPGRGMPGGVLEARTLGGALVGAVEERGLVGAAEERVLVAQMLGSALEARTL